MESVNKKKASLYEKQHSFEQLVSKHLGAPLTETKRSITLLEHSVQIPDQEIHYVEVLKQVLNDLKNPTNANALFKITSFIADETRLLEDVDLPRYLYHRYRYDVYPLTRVIDDFPPYLQIEPSSICNFRCVFCYQTDRSFNTRTSGHMGTMSLDIFKQIIDQVQGKIEFISLASRGEPLVCKDIAKMLEYTRDKFLGLKMNTNASLLTEPLAHAILSSGIKTIVFSADAAEEPLYSKLRVNGSLEKTVRNIEMFQRIRNEHYSKIKIITRVSGVKISEQQDMDSMSKFWGDRVDQVAFVKYNPWENIYEAKTNDVTTPCSDLWRRMFIWYDGLVNPCDSDYKSTLAVGHIKDTSLSQIWNSPQYQKLRSVHLNNKRNFMEPCSRCYVI